MKTITLHLMLASWKMELLCLIFQQKSTTPEKFKERFPKIDSFDIAAKFKLDYPNINLRSVVGLSVEDMKKEADDIYDFFVSIHVYPTIEELKNEETTFPEEVIISETIRMIREDII